MNKDRRKRIEKLISKIEELQQDIEEIAEDEQEYLDNIPENLQSSERHNNAENACYYLGEAAEAADEVISNLESAKE